MHGTNIQSSVVPDAVTIIAVCTASRGLAELAVALRMVATDRREIPPEELQGEAKDRIERNVSSPLWRAEARWTLGDPDVNELAWLFYQIFVQRVPTSSPYPLLDDEWLLGARVLFAQEPQLHVIANALLDQIRIPEGYYETPPERPVSKPVPIVKHESAPVVAPMPAPAIADAPPVVAAPAPAVPAQPEESGRAALSTRAQLVEKAKRFAAQFMRYYEAKKARETQQARPASPTPIAEQSQTSAASPVATPLIEGAVAVPKPAPSIVVPTRTRRQQPVIGTVARRSRYVRTPSRHRAVCRSRTLLQAVTSAPTHSPRERHSTSAPFRQIPQRMQILDAHSLPHQQSLSPPP